MFRIQDITMMGVTDRLFEVKLSLTSDDDQELRKLTNRVREETSACGKGWFRMGFLLLKMGQSSKAKEIYEILLEQSSDPNERGQIYNKIGLVYSMMGDYAKALSCNEKAFGKLANNHFLRIILLWVLPTTTLVVCMTSMGDYAKALSSYEKALVIYQQSLTPNHPNLAISYNNIALVYDKMGYYAKALSSYEKALTINQQSLPPNHPDLATTYNNIGGGVFQAWVTMRKHFHLTRKHWQLGNNHFLPIILIWVVPTTTSVWCIPRWVTMRKHFHLTKKHW